MVSSSSSAFRELQRDLENHANALSKIQKDIAKNHQVRKQYTIQLGENELVLKELELLKEDANVYKLIGPVLVKQDLAEANANVRKRMEYITAELKRLDGTLQDLEDQQNSKRETTAEGARLARRDLLPLFLGNKYMKDHFPAVAHVAMEINEAWREQHPKGRGARNVRQKSAKPLKDKEVASKNSITGPQKNKEVATKSSSGSKRAAAKKTLPAYSWWEDLKTACNLNKERQLYMPVPEGEFVGNAFRAWKQHVINAVGCAGPIELISRLETTSVPYEIYTVAKEAAQKIGIKWENLVTKPAILPDIVEGGTTTLSSDSSSGLPLGFEHTPRKRGRSSESEGAPSSSRPRTEVPNAADEATSAMPERDAGICFSPYIDAITGDATIPSGDASPNNIVVSPEAHFSPDVLDTPLNSPRLVTENDLPFGGGEEVPIQDEARETPENGFAEDVLEEGLDPPFENIPEGFNILAGVLPQVPSSNCSSEHLGEEGEILSETLVPQIPSELSVCVVSSTSTDVAPVAAGDGAQRSPSAEDVVPQEGVAEDISPARLLPTEGTQPSIQEAGTSQLPTDESVEPPPSTIIADHNNAADALKMDFQSTVHATFNEEIANIANSGPEIATKSPECTGYNGQVIATPQTSIRTESSLSFNLEFGSFATLKVF